MDLIALLREFGLDDDAIANVEAALASLADDYDGEPVDDETLATALATLVALADEDEASAALIGAAADAASIIRQENERREAEAEAEEAERAAAAARLRGEDATAQDGEDDGEDDGESAEDDGEDDGESAEDDGDGETAESADDPDRQPVVASSNRATRRAAARRRPRNAAPALDPHEDRNPIRFAAGLPGVREAETFDLRDVDRAMEQLYASFRRSSAPAGRQHLQVASVQGRFPEERRLVDESGESLAPTQVTRRIQSVIDEAIGAYMDGAVDRAIVAAGGICAPPTPIYNVVTYGDARRPIRDQALVSFLAGRGGVTDLTPPQLGDLSGAVSAWTVDDDIDALDPESGTVKPCLRVTCGEPRTTQIEAIPFCLTVGNFLQRTMAEIPTAWSSLGMVAHARFAESRLIAAMQALSTATTNTMSDWSATRDVLAILTQAAWGMRSRHRMPDSFPFRAVLPSILRGIMVTDLSRQMFPGQSGTDVLRIAAAELDAMFRARDINVTWSPDLNVVGPQGAGTLAHFPPTINYLIYPEGTFIHLDGGELDLGVVRDSALNSVNDFQTFSETFEGVHMVGTESIAGTIDVCPTGAVSGTIDPAPFCASYSN